MLFSFPVSFPVPSLILYIYDRRNILHICNDTFPCSPSRSLLIIHEPEMVERFSVFWYSQKSIHQYLPFYRQSSYKKFSIIHFVSLRLEFSNRQMPFRTSFFLSDLTRNSFYLWKPVLKAVSAGIFCQPAIIPNLCMFHVQRSRPPFLSLLFSTGLLRPFSDPAFALSGLEGASFK